MRKVVLSFTYAAALVIGALLLICNYQAMDADQSGLHNIIIAAGIIFILPGLFMLLASLKPHRDAQGQIIKRPWYSIVIAAASLVWGILMVCMPGGLLGNLNITLGVSIALAGIAGIVWTVRTAPRVVVGYIVSAACVVAGIVVLTALNDYPDNGRSAKMACIVAGIMLILWSLSGVPVLRYKSSAKALERERRKIEKREQKAVRKEASEAARREQADNIAAATPEAQTPKEESRPAVSDEKKESE